MPYIQKSLKSAQIIQLCTAQIWKENDLLSVTGCCLELPAIHFEEGEEEWSSDTNSLLGLLRSLIIELCNRSVTGVYSKGMKT